MSDHETTFIFTVNDPYWSVVFMEMATDCGMVDLSARVVQVDVSRWAGDPLDIEITVHKNDIDPDDGDVGLWPEEAA